MSYKIQDSTVPTELLKAQDKNLIMSETRAWHAVPLGRDLNSHPKVAAYSVLLPCAMPIPHYMSELTLLKVV